MSWQDSGANDYPVFVVGAGFPFAVLDSSLPSTGNIIGETATNHPEKFPFLKQLYENMNGVNTELNFVWTHMHEICEQGFFDERGSASRPSDRSHFEKAEQAYRELSVDDPMRVLFEDQRKRWEITEINRKTLAWILLGVELKRMLAMQYSRESIQLKSSFSELLCDLVDESKKSLWISLNYDLTVESFLETKLSPSRWRYAFQDVFEHDHWPDTSDALHVVVKPHGSLNIWFESQFDSATRILSHTVSFADSATRLATCPWDKVGYHGSPANKEVRPCVIGYLPEALKDELNSPGQAADASHDFHKWNLTYAALQLQKATSVFILGYSLPVEDGWMQSRLLNLRNRDTPIHVASKDDTKQIVESLKAVGFTQVEPLTADGCI